MKILVDIIHPANVHYFKNLVQSLILKGDTVTITSRDKDVTFALLNAYQLDYINLGKGQLGKGAIGKALYLIFACLRFSYIFIHKKPSICISFGSAPLAIVSYFFRVPHIAFDDTEHTKLNKSFYIPFSSLVFTPSCFEYSLGKKHITFNGYMELFYLHKNVFNPDISVRYNLKLKENEKLTLFRFVSWDAFHDIGQKGLSFHDKMDLIYEAQKHSKVYISSQDHLTDELTEYKLDLGPEQLHDVLYQADVCISEGGTTAAECAMLGTPSIYINSLPLMGYLKDAKNHKLLFDLKTTVEIKAKMREIYQTPNEVFQKQKDVMLQGLINPSKFLLWIVTDFSKNKKIIKSNPNYQEKFIE